MGKIDKNEFSTFIEIILYIKYCLNEVVTASRTYDATFTFY